jgi:YteA family regulatory protein
MEQWKLKKYKRILLHEQKRMNDLIESFEEHGLDDSLLEATGELSAYDNHPADLGDITFERGKDIALRDNNATFLSMTRDALEHIDNGTYGICDRCGNTIGDERLEAFPYTTMCIDCKEDVEFYDQPRLRPIEEDFLAPPFARTFTDDSDNVAFDGEDAWQAVAQYGTSNGPAYTMDAVKPEDAYYEADEELGIVDWGDAIVDDGFVEEFEDDEHTGQVTRFERREFERKD